MGVFDLGKNLLFKSILGSCEKGYYSNFDLFWGAINRDVLLLATLRYTEETLGMRGQFKNGEIPTKC